MPGTAHSGKGLMIMRILKNSESKRERERERKRKKMTQSPSTAEQRDKSAH